MHAQGHSVAVAGERGAWHWLFEKAPFPWIDAPLKGGPLGLLRAARIIGDYLSDHPVDLLHVHYRRSAMVARKVQKSFAKPILYTLHLSHIPLSWPWSRFTDFGDYTHAASADARDWLIESAHVRADRITLIPHGVDPRQFPLAGAEAKSAAKQSMGLETGDLVAAFVGRLDDPKNETWLLDLAAASRERLPNLKVILAGEGPHEAMLRRRIDQQKLQGRVILLGHREPRKIYEAADALLLPSEREGFSLVCAEAMSSGVPVLRTRTAGTREMIVEGVTGRSVPINRQVFITAAIEFLSDRTALQIMGEAAAKHVGAHLTFNRQVRDMIELYRDMVTRPFPLSGISTSRLL